MSYDESAYTWSNKEQLLAREELAALSNTYSAPLDEKERSQALFLRGSQLARFLAVFELYQLITKVPGVIFDLGAWRGSTSVLCENFRAILEPLNFQRQIFAFDTFEGYSGFSENEICKDTIRNGSYSVEPSYDTLLANILGLHEKNNAMGHISGKHSVVKGDCRVTVKQLLEKRPNLIISLAFFDLNSFEPTKDVLELILDFMPPGGVIAFWQLTRDDIQAEGQAYHQLINKKFKHTLRKSEFYPSLSYVLVGDDS